MKPQYKLHDDTYWWLANSYSLVCGHYFRAIRTHNERKQNKAAIADGYKVRGKRRNLRTHYDDVGYSQMYGKDWKRFTKRKHQYKDKT